MTLQEAVKKNWQILLQDRNTKKYFILGDSDNYGYDCYSFTEDKEQEDGFIPFCADCMEEGDEELIDKWNEEMNLEQRVDYCLKGMGSSLDACEIIDDEDLLEELCEEC